MRELEDIRTLFVAWISTPYYYGIPIAFPFGTPKFGNSILW